MNDDSRLQDFATLTLAKGRITFGDVRRLQRDYRPEGLFSIEEIRVVLALDADIARTDRAWVDWLVAAVVDFAGRSEEAVLSDETSIDTWLQDVFPMSASAGVRRRIARELRRDIQRAQPITLSDGEDPADVRALVVPDVGVVVSDIPLAA